MKIKKIIMSIIFISIIIVVLLQNNSNATTLSTPSTFGIIEIGESDIGFSIGDASTNELDDEATKIWNIIKYTTETTYDYTNNLYCLKAGVGFSSTTTTQSYDLTFDMYEDKEEMAVQNETLNSIVNGDYYNNLLALANLIWIPEQSTDSEKTTLLESAGIYKDQYDEESYIPDDLIIAVQQSAIWYYTNFDEDGKYDKTQDDSWIYYTTDGLSYYKLEDYETVGIDWMEQANLLYNYLIKTAEENAISYESETIVYKNELILYASSTNSSAQPIIEIVPKEKEFDLALRNYIVEVDGEEVETREPVINVDSLNEGTETTATYSHRKDPVSVSNGSVVKYNITIYNEGETDGKATEIVDQLPTGLTFTELQTEGWTSSYDEETNILTLKRNEDNTENLSSYDGLGVLDSETITIICTVDTSQFDTNSYTSIILTNVTWISAEEDADGNKVESKGDDRDSEPTTSPSVNKDNMENYTGEYTISDNENLSNSEEFYKGKQDDDDFEKLIVEEHSDFDLKVVKMVTAVNGEEVQGRLLDVDTSSLADGTSTTATYSMTKYPVTVQTGDLVTYTIRVYNEGYIDGYAQEITEEIPEGMEFLGAEIDSSMNEITDEDELEAVKYNASYGWTYVSGDMNKITTTYLAKGNGDEITTDNANLIKAFDGENLSYVEISVIFKVTTEESSVIKNEVAITSMADADGNPVEDRDSSTDSWNKQDGEQYYNNDKDWPVHEEDDEDYDNVMLESVFDLSLKKYITDVSGDEVTNRTPKVSYNSSTKKLSYSQVKDAVEVVTGDTVTFTIRVYNEGEIDGYASLISDDIPDGLEFLPDDKTNEKYRWVMYDEDGNKTTDVNEAATISTDYLSRRQEENEGDNLLKAFNSEESVNSSNPSYKDVKVVFKVTKPSDEANTTIINSAQISKNTDANGNLISDIDSTPGEWNENEDDQDQEYLEIKYFDLSISQCLTKVTVTEDGVETITETGQTEENSDSESLVKVELYKKKVKKSEVNVKINYTITVTNEGDIAGYAKEIKDYLPSGMEYIAEDNKIEWTDEGNNVISTKTLSKTLIEPGESEEIELVLSWISGEETLGEKINTVEISEDYNKQGVADKDSTADNQEDGEDDIASTLVLLSIATGSVITYFALGIVILIILILGIIYIKKFVLVKNKK